MAQGDWPEEGPPDDGIGRRWKVGGLVAAVAAFLLVSAAIHISTYQVGYGTRIYAQPRLVAGERTALRVAAFVVDESNFARDLEAEVFLVSVDSGSEVRLGGGRAGPTRAVEVNTRLPAELTPGRYRLRVESRTDAGDPEVAAFPVEVVAADDVAPSEWMQLRNVCEEGARRLQRGGWSRSPLCHREEAGVRLYPESGSLVANLENRIHVWSPGLSEGLTVRQLAPRPGPGLPRPETSAEPEELEVDSMGIASFALLPSYPRGETEVVAGERREEILLRDLPSQVLVETQRVMLRPDEPLEARVRLLRAEVPVFIDVWSDGRWIGADALVMDGAGAIGYEVALPEGLRGFVAVRAYTSVDGPAGAYDERLFYVDDDAETAIGVRTIARVLASLPEAPPLAGEDERPPPEPLPAEILAAEPVRFAKLDRVGLDRAAAVLLSRVEVSRPAAPLLGDTTTRKQEALETWKRSLRRPLLSGLISLAIAVFLGAGYLIVSGQRAVRRRLAELDIDDQVLPETEEEGAGPGRISTAGVLAQGVLILLVLGAAVVGLLVLLETLRWDWGR